MRVAVIELQQKRARVQSLLGLLEIAAKELEADGAFFVSGSPQLQARTSIYGEVPDDGPRWTGAAEIPGYAGVVVPGERGETLAHLSPPLRATKVPGDKSPVS